MRGGVSGQTGGGGRHRGAHQGRTTHHLILPRVLVKAGRLHIAEGLVEQRQESERVRDQQRRQRVVDVCHDRQPVFGCMWLEM